MKLIMLLTVVCMAFINVKAKLSEFDFKELTKYESSNKTASIQTKTYSISENVIDAISQQRKLRLNNFPISKTQKGNLLLNKTKNIIHSESQFYCGNTNIDAPEMHTYVGNIEGSDNSTVLMTVVNGKLFTTVKSESETTYFMPSVSSSNNVLLFQSDNYISGTTNNNDCHEDLKFFNELRSRISKREQMLSNDLLELELAYEADSEIFKASGSDFEKAQAYVLTLLTQVSNIYEEFINVRIKLNWVKVWTDNPSDPYDANGDWQTLRNNALIYWSDNYSDVERDIYHVSTAISYGGGGFGYFDALCGNKYYGMSVTSLQGANNLPTFNFSYDVYILAHELGHNFNAQHTHSCFWNDVPLDTCIVDKACLPAGQQPLPNPGSIMSYCGGTNNSAGLGYQVKTMFRPENIEIMRTIAEDAPCLSTVEEPHLLLLSPRGQERFEAVDSLHIMWKAYNCETIDIHYSTDAGINWTLIESSVDAQISTYNWTLPDLCSNEMLVRINDNSNLEYADTSMLTFSIKVEDENKLVAYYPFDGNGNDEQACHFFNASPVNNVRYSADRFTIENKALELDGTNYMVVDEYDATFDELTVTYWLNAATTEGNQALVGTNWAEGWVFSTYFWGQLGFSLYLDGGGAPEQVWAGQISTDTWHYAAFTFDGFSAKIYLNGELRGEKTWEEKATLNSFPKTPLYIGSRKDNDYFSGKLDEVKIFNKALSIDEIMEMVDINEFGTNNIKSINISPNPATDYLEITFVDHRVNPMVQYREIEIFDVLGKSLLRNTPSSLHDATPLLEGNKRLDVSHLQPGIYFVRVNGEMLKFVKM